jgi:hypothetical protein
MPVPRERLARPVPDFQHERFVARHHHLNCVMPRRAKKFPQAHPTLKYFPLPADMQM